MVRRVPLIRHAFRRARWFVFFAGLALSCLFLAVASTAPYPYTGSDLLERTGDHYEAYLKFLILNPPAIALHPLMKEGAPLGEPLFDLMRLAVSIVWWLFLAVLFRRKHARPVHRVVV